MYWNALFFTDIQIVLLISLYGAMEYENKKYSSCIGEGVHTRCLGTPSL